MRAFFRLLVFCVVLPLAPPTAWAAAPEQALLIVRAEGYFPPNEMLVDGQLTGIHIDLIQAAATSLRIPVVIRSYPWLRAIAMLQNGDADAITYMAKTPEREEFGIFEDGNELATTYSGFLVLKENAAKVVFSGDMNQLRPYSIGLIRGRRSYPDFDQADYLKKDNSAADDEHLLRMLLLKRFDLALVHVSRVKHLAKSLNVEDQLVFLQPYGPAVSNFLVFSKSKGHGQLAKRFAQAMVAVKKSPKFQEILKKYGVNPADF